MHFTLSFSDRERAVAGPSKRHIGRLLLAATVLVAFLTSLLCSNPAAAAGNGKVVIIGDSIVDYWSQNANGFFPGKPYVNKGIGGETTSQIAKRFDRDVVGLNPSVVVLQGGINDMNASVSSATISRIEQNYSAMIDKAKARGIRVVVLSVFPVAFRQGGMTVFTSRRAKVNAAVRTTNSRLKSLAAKKGVIYLDLYSAISDPNGELADKYNSDNVHITYAAYDFMAPLVERAVATASR